MTHVTCRLTAKNWDQLRNPTLGNRVWATFTFLGLVELELGSVLGRMLAFNVKSESVCVCKMVVECVVMLCVCLAESRGQAFVVPCLSSCLVSHSLIVCL